MSLTKFATTRLRVSDYKAQDGYNRRSRSSRLHCSGQATTMLCCCELCEQPIIVAHEVRDYNAQGARLQCSGRATTMHRVHDYKACCCELCEQPTFLSLTEFATTGRFSPKGTSSLRSGRATTTCCCELCEQPTFVAHKVSPKGTSSLRSGRATTTIAVAHIVRYYCCCELCEQHCKVKLSLT